LPRRLGRFSTVLKFDHAAQYVVHFLVPRFEAFEGGILTAAGTSGAVEPLPQLAFAVGEEFLRGQFFAAGTARCITFPRSAT